LDDLFKIGDILEPFKEKKRSLKFTTQEISSTGMSTT